MEILLILNYFEKYTFYSIFKAIFQVVKMDLGNNFWVWVSIGGGQL